MLGHPKIGVEYDVQDDIGVTGVEGRPESLVPIGYDSTGNLQVDAYGFKYPDDGKVLLWSESGFCKAIEDNKIE